MKARQNDYPGNLQDDESGSITRQSLDGKSSADRVRLSFRLKACSALLIGMAFLSLQSVNAQAPRRQPTIEAEPPKTLEGYFKTFREPRLIESQEEIVLDNGITQFTGLPRYNSLINAVELTLTKPEYPSKLTVPSFSLNPQQAAQFSASILPYDPKPPFAKHVVLQMRDGFELPVTLEKPFFKNMTSGVLCNCNLPQVCKQIRVKPGETFCIDTTSFSQDSLSYIQRWSQALTLQDPNSSIADDIPYLCKSNEYVLVSPPAALNLIPDWIRTHSSLSVETLAMLLLQCPEYSNKSLDVKTPLVLQHLVEAGDELQTWEYDAFHQPFRFSGRVIGRLDRSIVFSPGFSVRYIPEHNKGMPAELRYWSLKVAEMLVRRAPLKWIDVHTAKDVYQTRLFIDRIADGAVPLTIEVPEPIAYPMAGGIPKLKPLEAKTRLELITLDSMQLGSISRQYEDIAAFGQFAQQTSKETIHSELAARIAEIDRAQEEELNRQMRDFQQSRVNFPTTYPEPMYVSLSSNFVFNVNSQLKLQGRVEIDRGLENVRFIDSSDQVSVGVTAALSELDDATFDALQEAFKQQNVDLKSKVELTSPQVKLMICGSPQDVTLISKLLDGYVISSDRDKTCEDYKVKLNTPFVIPRTVLSTQARTVLDDWFARNPALNQSASEGGLDWLLGSRSPQAIKLPQNQAEVAKWISGMQSVPMDELVIALTHSPALKKLSEDANERKAIAIDMAARTCHLHSAWTIEFGSRRIRIDSKVLGRIESGFVFEHGFYSPSKDLNPIDVAVLSKQIISDRPNWMNELDLAKVFRTRLSPNAGTADTGQPFVLVGKKQVSGAYEGLALELANPAGETVGCENVGPAFMNRSIDLLPEIEAFEAFVNATTKEDLPRKLASRISPLNLAPGFTATLNTKIVRTWVFSEPNAGQVVSFDGILQGSVGDQFAFSFTADADSPIFLVSRNDFPKTTREQIEQTLKAHPLKLDKSRLQVANDIPFRLVYVKETDSLLDAQPIAVKEVSLGVMSFYRRENDTTINGSQRINPAQVRRLVQLLSDNEQFATLFREGMTSYALRDTEVPLYGTLVTVVDDQDIFKNSLEQTFRVASMHLDQELLKRIKEGQETTTGTAFEVSEVLKLPTLLIGRQKLFGPGAIRFLTEPPEREISLRLVSGVVESIPMGHLTLRQSLALKSMAAAVDKPSKSRIDEWLANEVPPESVIRSAPVLRSDLAERLKRHAPPRTITWNSQELTYPNDWALNHVQYNGERAILRATDGSIYISHLSSGRQIKLPKLENASEKMGPWVASNHAVWAMAAGKLYRFMLNAVDKNVAVQPGPIGSWVEHKLGADDETITAADVSANGQYLWAQLERVSGERRFVRLSLLNESVLELTYDAVEDVEQRPRVEQLVADRDGVACGVKFPGYFAVIKPKLDAGANADLSKAQQLPEQLVLGLLTNIDPVRMKLGSGYLIYQMPNMNSLQVLNHTKPSQPYSMNSVGELVGFGFCESEGKSFIQMVTRQTDKYSRDKRLCSLSLISVTESHSEQVSENIIGEFDENSHSTHDGRTWFHRREGKPMRSSTHEPVVAGLYEEIDTVVRALYRDGNVGQLESLFIQASRDDQAKRGARLGGAGEIVLDALERAMLTTHLDAGGDALERAEKYLWHLRSKFPNSEVIRLLMVCWYVQVAWDYRGGDFADTVTQKQWKLFEENLTSADDLIQSLFESPNPSPEVFAKAVQIHMGLQRDSAELSSLKEKIYASNARTSPSIHSAIVLASLPRWGGEPGESDQYLSEMTEELGDDGPMVYAATLAVLTEANPQVTAELEINVDRLLAGTIKYYEHYTDPKLLDAALLQLARLQAYEPCDQLLKLRADKSIGSSRIATSYARQFRQIDTIPDQFEKLRQQQPNAQPNRP